MLSSPTTKENSIKEAVILEELFLDQLIFKISAIMNLYTFEKKSRREIISFIDQLNKLTKENIKILNSYDD